MNRVILYGNLTRDPEMKNIGTTNVTNFSIAINRQTRAGQETTYVEISSFGKTAENIAKYFQKGKPILIEGRLKMDEWQDKQTGQKRTKLKVIAEKFEFVGSAQQQTSQQATASYVPAETQAPAAPPSPFI